LFFAGQQMVVLGLRHGGPVDHRQACVRG
jgi:hypothetical protein